MSFVMLTESHVQLPSRLEHAQAPNAESGKSPASIESDHSNQQMLRSVDYSNKMFELLSARSDVDHPICSDCTELLLTSMQGHLAASLKERDAYIGFLKDIKSHSLTDAEIAKIAEDIANTRDSEQKAQAELLDLEGDKARLENELAELDAASRELDMVEEAFWRSRNQFDQTLSSVKDTCDALNAYISHDIQQLDRLERTNVYNDTFFISHDGPFGTINGLRLGRLPPPNNVEWPEINAAWGSTALLIATVADRIGLTFQGYRLRPMGSTSRIERLDGVTPPVMPDVAGKLLPEALLKRQNLNISSF